MGDLSSRRRLRGPHRRQTLLEAAESTFAEHGYERARLEDIAQAAGVTKALVYRHFASKDDLFLAAVSNACRSLEEALAATLREAGPPDAMLARALRVWFDFVAKRQAGFVLVSRLPGTQAALALLDETRDRIVRGIAEVFPARNASGLGVSSREARRLMEGTVRSIIGAAEAVATWWARTKPYSVDVAWLTVMNLTWLGLERLSRGELWLPRDTAAWPGGVGRK